MRCRFFPIATRVNSDGGIFSSLALGDRSGCCYPSILCQAQKQATICHRRLTYVRACCDSAQSLKIVRGNHTIHCYQLSPRRCETPTEVGMPLVIWNRAALDVRYSNLIYAPSALLNILACDFCRYPHCKIATLLDIRV